MKSVAMKNGLVKSLWAVVLLSSISLVQAKVANKATEVNPLLIGATVPGIELKNAAGDAVQLNTMFKQQPSILVYYRGGWCAYCLSQLKGLAEAKDELIDMGYQVIAVSADKPKKIQEFTAKNEFDYTLLSDNTMTGAQKLGIAFRLKKDLVKMYKERYKIDIERDSGEKHNILPVPSVFLIDAGGVIRFSYVNPDYKTRLEKDVLLSAAQAALK